jgi:hypothetical protein
MYTFKPNNQINADANCRVTPIQRFIGAGYLGVIRGIFLQILLCNLLPCKAIRDQP